MDTSHSGAASVGDKAVDNTRPTRPLVLYDGDCGFCTTSALAAHSRWFESKVDVSPFQRVDLAVHRLTVDKCGETLHAVDADGRTHTGSDAVAVVLRESRLPWPLLGGALRLPGVRWAAQRIYALVARNRHRLPGGSPTCEL